MQADRLEELAALWDEYKHREARSFERILERWHIRDKANKNPGNKQLQLNVIAYTHEEEAVWISVANRSSLQLLT
jgi:hypothetical protein